MMVRCGPSLLCRVLAASEMLGPEGQHRGWSSRSVCSQLRRRASWLVAERLAGGWWGRAWTLTVTVGLGGLCPGSTRMWAQISLAAFCKYCCCELGVACFFSSLCCFLCMCTQEWDC